jgi:hypothetical protein
MSYPLQFGDGFVSLRKEVTRKKWGQGFDLNQWKGLGSLPAWPGG